MINKKVMFLNSNKHLKYKINNLPNDYSIKILSKPESFIEKFIEYSPHFLIKINSEKVDQNIKKFLDNIGFDIINFYDNEDLEKLLKVLENTEYKTKIKENLNSYIIFNDNNKSEKELKIKTNNKIYDINLNETERVVLSKNLIKAEIKFFNKIEMDYNNLGFKILNKNNQEIGFGIFHRDDLYLNQIVNFPIFAICNVSPKGQSCNGKSDKDNKCKGTININQIDRDNVIVDYKIEKLIPSGLHGFHIHEKADFSNGCKSAGPHFNPFNYNHGSSNSEIRHVGDLGNIESNENGVADGLINLNKSGIKLYGPPEFSIINRSVMIHEGEDDLGRGKGILKEESLKTGNAGARLACGKILLIE